MAPTVRYKQKGLRLKATALLKKTALRATFACAVGATLYANYGTTHYITGKITNLELWDGGTKTIVYTNRGTFINEPGWLRLKGGETTRQLTKELQKAGSAVQLKVYGPIPDAGLSFFGFNAYGNIIGVEKDPLAPVAASPVTIHANDGCVMNSNLEEISATMPRLAQDLDTMRRLTLSGKPLFDTITDPVNGIETCLKQKLIDEGKAGEFNNVAKRITMIPDADTNVILHEGFHAGQSLRVNEFLSALSVSDFIAASLLKEATAVAYELVTQREALNKGIALNNDEKFMSASRTQRNIGLFDTQYESAVSSGASEAKALEKAGKAIVLSLLDGDNSAWSAFYARQSVDNANSNLGLLLTRKKGGDYSQFRSHVFRQIGQISPDINLVPDEYLNENADARIEKNLGRHGISISRAATKTPRMLG